MSIVGAGYLSFRPQTQGQCMYLWLDLYLNGAHGTLLCPGFFHGCLTAVAAAITVVVVVTTRVFHLPIATSPALQHQRLG